jgi:hypothetical protein
MALLPLYVFAVDLGFLADQNVSMEAAGDLPDDPINYKLSLVPWFSSPLGDNGDLYLSAGFSVNYENQNWDYFPELFRADLAYRFGNGEIRAGRMHYSDPVGFIASGLLDGLSVAMDTSIGSFSAGLWYTGLFYKKTINITMTQEDLDSYSAEFSYDDFADTYFSSRRLLAALGWEHPGLNELVRLKISLLNQADLNGRDNWLHSQYLAVKATVPVKTTFVLELGGTLALVEMTDSVKPGMAGELGLSFFLPTPFQDRLRVGGIFSSGTDDSLSAFVPVTTAAQGQILAAKISGLSHIDLDYTVRLHRTFSLSVLSSYFVLSDKGSYQGWPAKRDGYFLGNEFYGRLIWSPVSDLQLKLGGGLFVPAMGDADPGKKPKWKVELNARLAVF